MLPSALAQEPRSRRQLHARRQQAKLSVAEHSFRVFGTASGAPDAAEGVGGGREPADPVSPVWARVPNTSNWSESVCMSRALAWDRTTLSNSHRERVHVVGALVVGAHHVRPQRVLHLRLTRVPR